MSVPQRLLGSRRAALWRKLEMTAVLEWLFCSAATFYIRSMPGNECVVQGCASVPGLRRNLRVLHNKYFASRLTMFYKCSVAQRQSYIRA